LDDRGCTFLINIFKHIIRRQIATGPLDRPAAVKTHLRDMIIVPEMIGSTVAVYNGKIFNVVDVKAEMVGYYLGEFSITYRYSKSYPRFTDTIDNKAIEYKENAVKCH
jgi:ribosomal protein uS19